MAWVLYNKFQAFGPSTTHPASFNMLQQKHFKEKYYQSCFLKQLQLKKNSDRFQLIEALAEEILAKKGFSDYVQKAILKLMLTSTDSQSLISLLY